MIIPNFTAAQKRAILWLPADGSWTTTPKDIAPAVQSLAYGKYKSICETQWNARQRKWEYRLTPAGIATRAALASTKEASGA